MPVVTSLTDDVNDPNYSGSLRFAIDNATSGDVITFAPGLAGGTISLGATLDIDTGLTIDGGTSGIVIDGQNQVTDFTVSTGSDQLVTLQNLTIANGNGVGPNAPGIPGQRGGDAAGGLYVLGGSVALSNIQFDSNTATGGKGANAGVFFGNDKAAGSGGNAAGAVYVDPSATVVSASNLTFTNNSATGGMGGAPDAANPTPGASGTAFPDSNNQTVRDAAVCFATGALIRTSRGDVAVEALIAGDLAVTASGATRPIKWIGRRTFDCAAHPDPAFVRPIRVAAGAFGSGKPYRDLTLSPHHAIAVTCLDEVLIPIRLLVNGSTITQIEAGEITYWHVELDSHDILIANGLPAESYIDVGNRCEFEDQDTLVLHPAFKSDARETAMSAYCRPLVTGGSVLSAVRGKLAAIAGDQGTLTGVGSVQASTFHLLVDGTRIAPAVKDHRAAFVVPAGAKDIRLVSPAWSPRDADPTSADDRRLGLMLRALTIDDLLGTAADIPLDDPALVAGFHPVERTMTGRWRWTDGDARLAPSLFARPAGSFVLRIEGWFTRVGAKNLAEAA